MFLADLWVAEILLAALAAAYIISGVDDLAIDLFYWFNFTRRRLRGRRQQFPRLRESDLKAVPEKKAAIFVAAWHEDDVIEQMLAHNSKLIDYKNYDFFVGTYPNDPATQAKVDAARRHVPNVFKAVTPHPGPTSKADCLNSVFAELVKQEEISGERYEFILMHDPEDVLHPLELKLDNYLLARPDISMVQTPIFPIEVPARCFTAGTYADEFAETHTKDMYVREWIRGFVPSAGVATAIKRDALACLGQRYGDELFNPGTLTEDYDFSLRLKLCDQKAIFVRQAVLRLQPATAERTQAWREEHIATRAHFPRTFKTAVRQRTRWSLGIIFQGWKNIGWQGNWQTRWLLFHDRKGVWTNTLVPLGYLFALYLFVCELLKTFVWRELSPPLPDHAWIGWASLCCALLMVNRLVQRAVATTRVYGYKQGAVAIPRQVWGNIINSAATLRAAWQFARAEMRGKTIAWDKTAHYFPTAVSAPIESITDARRRIGELLIEHGRITAEQVDFALIVQELTRDPLGEVLVGLKHVTEGDLVHALCAQNDGIQPLHIETPIITAPATLPSEVSDDALLLLEAPADAPSPAKLCESDLNIVIAFEQWQQSLYEARAA